MNELGLGMVFSAKDTASSVMQKLSQEMINVAGKTSLVGQAVKKQREAFDLGMKTMNAGATMLSGAVSLANISGEFNREIASVGAIAQASAADLKVLHDAAIEAGIATQFSPKEAAEGLGELASAGYNATESTKLLIPTLDLAAGGQISVAQAAATMSAATKVFNLSVEESSVATDKLLAIANATSLGANDLQLALGNVARGAVATGQSLDEMLPAMGLVKNTGVQASVASSAVSSALLSIADKAALFKSDLGVEVTDAAGKFKPLMDIILEADEAMSKKFPNAAERTAKSFELFGKFGLTAFSGISAQLKGGITGAGGQKLFGAEAVADLRKQMANAAGAAAAFRDKLLDTFEGQKTLLKGSVETMAVVLGEPFERALKPVVSFILEQFNKVLNFVKQLPDGTKNLIAKVVLGVGVLTVLTGGFLAAAAAAGMLATGIGALGVSVGGVLAVLIPAVVATAALVGLVYAFYRASENPQMGQWGKVATLIFQVKMAFEALQQLFTDGGLSGDALSGYLGGDKAVQFAVDVYVAFNKVYTFLESMVGGFMARIDQMGPTFDRVSKAIDGLLQTLGLADPTNVDENAIAMDRWAQAGETAGKLLGDGVDLAANAIASAIEFADGFAQKWDAIADGANGVRAALSQAGAEIMSIAKSLGLVDEATGKSGSGWKTFGSVVGGVVAVILGALRGLLAMGGQMIAGLTSVFGGFIEYMHGVFTLDLTKILRGLARMVYGALSMATAPLLGMLETIAGVIDGIRNATGGKSDLAGSVAKFREFIRKDFRETIDNMGPPKPSAEPDAATAGPAAGPGETPWPKDLVDFYAPPENPYAPTVDNLLVAEAAAAGEGQADVEGLNAAVQDLRSAKEAGVSMSGPVYLDGDQVGTYVANQQSGAGKAAGRPAPTTGS